MATGADGRYRRRALSGAATPTRVVGMSARCPHRRASLAPTRVYPPRGVDNPLTMSTTPSRCRQRAPAFAPLRFHCGRRGPRPPGCAHKDPDLRNMRRTQGLDPALVCGAVLLNSIPCVRHGPGQADACCRAGALSPGRRMLRALTGAVGAVGRCYADAAGPGVRGAMVARALSAERRPGLQYGEACPRQKGPSCPSQ